MGRKPRYLVLIFSLLFFGRTALAAQLVPEAIKPFGNLAWDDSFTSVAQKIKRWPGIVQCEARYLTNKADLISTSSTQDLNQIPEQLYIYQFEAIGSPWGVAMFPRHRDWRTGKEWEYISQYFDLDIYAEPVMLHGVPFSLRAHFVASAGAIIHLQKNVYLSRQNVLIPLVLDFVKLESTSKALNQYGPALKQQLMQKYGGDAGDVGDAYGNHFNFMGIPEDYSIIYRNGLPSRLKNAYDQYLTKLAVQDGQKKPDLSGGL